MTQTYLDYTALQYYDDKVLTRLTQHVAAALAQVDSKIAAVAHLKIKKVDSLPTSSISTDTIYLVPKATADQDEQNVLVEYIYIDGEWEIIGDMEVDLSDYMKTETATATFLSKTDASNTYLTKTTANSTYAKSTDLEAVEATANNAYEVATNITAGRANALKAVGDASGNDIETTYAKNTEIIKTVKVGGTELAPDSNRAVDITAESLRTALGTATPSQKGLMSADQATKLSNAVPNTRTVNGKALSGDITTCIYQGEYVSGSTYYMGDIVCYERSFWQCVKESTSAEPTANLSTTWVELARAITNDEIDALFE